MSKLFWDIVGFVVALSAGIILDRIFQKHIKSAVWRRMFIIVFCFGLFLILLDQIETFQKSL